MSYDDFLKLTPLTFYRMLEDQKEFEISKIRPACEAIRRSTQWIVNVQLPRKKRIRKLKTLMIFPWEKQEGKKRQTAEQMKDAMRLIAARSKIREELKKKKQ